MAKRLSLFSPASWARTFRNELKKENLEIVRRIGNEVFYRATEKGSDWAIHDMLHALFLVRGVLDKAENALLLAGGG